MNKKELTTLLNITIVFIVFVLMIIVKNIFLLKGIIILMLVIGILSINMVRNKVKKIEVGLKATSRRYIMAIESMNGAIWEWDDKSRTIYISSMIGNLLSLEKEHMTAEEWINYIVEEDRDYVIKYLSNICLNRLLIDASVTYRVKDIGGNIRYLSYKGKGSIKNDVYYLSGVITDITSKRNQEKIIKDSLEKYKQIIDSSKDIVFCWDVKKSIITFDNKMKEYIDFNKYDEIDDEIILTYKEWQELLVDEDKEAHESLLRNFLVGKPQEFFEDEYRIKTKNNTVKWIYSKGKKVKSNDGDLLVYGLIADINDRKQKEIEIDYMSYYDEVTGYPNRRKFTADLEESIERCSKINKKLALIFIDLDNFKHINDSYGHDMGDMVLRGFCEKLNKVLTKACRFARFGGDEFVVAIEYENEKKEVKTLLEDILDKLREPLKIMNKEIYCYLSMGVSIYPNDALTIEGLLKNADMAMYKAKENGKNRYEFFDVNISKEIDREYRIEKALHKAIEKNEIYLEFQPKITLVDKQINGFEILVRWKNEELGQISPKEFIPIAENTGMMVKLGNYIIEESFKRCKELTLLLDKKIHFAINISDIQLRDEEFVSFISKKLKENDLSPEYIEFEITEGIIMQSVTKNIDTILNLKELGITIALDDFGTGYSSLSYLRRLPIDVLKIDKSFIDDIGAGIDEKSEYIAEVIIDLSHNLDLKVVAEGVETSEQLGYLYNINCDMVQGYYFSKPQSFKNIKKMLLIE